MDDEFVAGKFDEAALAQGRDDGRKIVGQQAFQVGVGAIAGGDEQKSPRPVLNPERLHEVVVLGAVAGGQIQGVNRVVALCGKPAGQAARQLGVGQELHAASGSKRLVWARRAA